MKSAFKILGVMLALSALMLAYKYIKTPSCEDLRFFLTEKEGYSGLAYVVMASVVSLLFFPRVPLILIAGIVFPFWKAVLVVTFATQISAAVGFMVGRHLMADFYRNWAEKKPWFVKMSRMLLENDLSVAALLRLSHLPFTPITYFSGLMPMRFWSYSLGTFLGCLPSTVIWVYSAGTLGCELMDRTKPLPAEFKNQLLFVTLASTVLAVVPILIHRLKRRGVAGHRGI